MMNILSQKLYVQTIVIVILVNEQIFNAYMYILHVSLNSKANSALINFLSVLSIKRIVFLIFISNLNKKKEKMQLVRPAIKFILNDVYTKEVEFTTQTKISMLRGKNVKKT